MSARFTPILCASMALTLASWGCGEDKKPETTEEAAATATGEEAAAPAADAKPAYVIPEALSAKEVKAQYGKGKLRKATKLNTKAIKARRKKKSDKAIEHYKAAIALSPGYVKARFNLACEHARFGRADEAFAELEHLFRMGTPEAMAKVGKLQVDSDFDPIRDDPRMKVVEAFFAADLDKPIFKQLCANRGKAIGMIDHEAGFYGITMEDSDGPAWVAGSKKVKGGKGRTLFFDLLDSACNGKKVRACDASGSAMLSDSVLSKWTEKYRHRCVDINGIIMPDEPEEGGDGHGSGVEGSVCFIRQGQKWIVGSAGVWHPGGRDSDMEPGIKKIVKKAVKEWGS